MSNQKMREALQAAYEAHKDDFEQPWLSLAAEALAIPADEQMVLTDEEIDKERLAMFPNVDEAAVLACADRIKRAIGTEQPAVAMNACYLMMQAINFLEGGGAA